MLIGLMALRVPCGSEVDDGHGEFVSKQVLVHGFEVVEGLEAGEAPPHAPYHLGVV